MLQLLVIQFCFVDRAFVSSCGSKTRNGGLFKFHYSSASLELSSSSCFSALLEMRAFAELRSRRKHQTNIQFNVFAGLMKLSSP